MREDRGPGRPRGFDEAQVLERLLNLFWQKGYDGASLSDLECVTGLGRGSLYAAFGEKEAMYRAAFAAYEARVVDQAMAMLTGPDGGTGRERIAQLLNAAVDPVRQENDRRGCFLCNTAADHGVHDAATLTAVGRSFQKLEVALGAALASALPADTVDTEDVSARARMVLAAYAGLRVLVRAGFSVEALQATAQATLARALAP
jgi:AcrR family transcriptional regulator